MSQNPKYRYSTCPQCVAIAKRRAAEAEAAATADYGTGTWKEFLAKHKAAVELQRLAANLAADVGPHTLRELNGYGLTKGIEGVSEPQVCMEYEAECPHCGLAISREYAQPFTVSDKEPADAADPGG